MTNGLVALGSATVFAIYAAGYARTKAASERFADDAAPRRRPVPVPAETPPPTSSLPPLAETAAPKSGAVAAPAGSGPTAIRTAPVEAPTAPAAPTSDAAAPTRDRTTTVAKPTVTSEGVAVAAASVSTPAPTPAVTAPAAAPVAAMPEIAAVATATPAPAALAAAAVSAPGKVVLKDGSYTGWGTCRHGDIQATVVVASGRILSATISQCWTRYPCSWISPLPPQVVQRQSPEVDYVTGATQSTNAFYDAVMDALAKAK